MRFSQVDVFSAQPMLGNPVAVVHDADDVTDEEMAAFARWTNLSETTFLLRPSTPEADYRLRIWTPGGELPFAGHPTLGSAHAWLEAGGAPAGEDLVQECGAGLVRIRRGATLSFAAPPLTRSGPVSDEDVDVIATALAITRDQIVETAWIDNGPGWVGVLLRDAETVLGLEPDWASFGDLKIGVVGPYADGPLAAELRAFCPGYGMPEDPVTGSLNAGVGQWLAGRTLPTSYVASQGTVLQRAGRVHVELVDGQIWVGGETRTTVAGSVDI
ncbi:PhzF family phenazine biosynthesis protein [Nocardioides sp. SR21]|uniref:PhzF family phenazine biosynthesis protein n=1 Tax=Nocardioides sp. SR21 TaxID=2919501 RepID=UPI001FAA19F9|nr:PhzF family phenazine biosynthesis protein [Nocardioides sp. SR21]